MLNTPWLSRLSLLVIGMLFSVYAHAQLSQTVKGQIFDADSEQSIIGASILIVGSEPLLGTTTEIDGSFRLEGVPVGRHSLLISSIGYEDAYIHELEIGSGKEVVLNIPLTESLIRIDEVVVSAERLNGSPTNDMATVSARSFSVEQTKRYAAAINDPARMAMSFAGVASGNDESNEIIIRGNSPRGVLWRMEGVEIPHPNHFSEQGATGGGISALSVNMLSNSDFFISAFPAEYGNAVSGVFDLKLRNGNNDRQEYALQFGALGLDLAAEGPIGQAGGASYLVNYRYSTLGILNAMGLEITDGNTNFQDIAFKLHSPGRNGHLSLWGMGAISGQKFVEADEEFDYSSDRAVLGLNHRRNFKDAYLETILSYAISKESDIGYFLPAELEYTERFVNSSWRASILYNRKFDARHSLRLGAIGSRLAYDFEDSEEQRGERFVGVQEDGSTNSYQAYAQWKSRLGSNLHLTGGIHALMLGLDNQVSIEPRLGLRWNFKPGQVLSAGFGRHSRIEDLAVYFGRVQDQSTNEFSQPNTSLPLGGATHAVLGYEWRFAPRWRLQTEVYYQELDKVPVASPWVSSQFVQAATASWINAESGYVTDSVFADGSGRNYGLEITLEKFFTDGWYLLATTSLYRSLYTPQDGNEYPTRFDGRFVTNLLAGREWTVGKAGTNLLGLNIRMNLSGGNRVTPIDLEASRQAGFTIRDFNRPFADQLPNYFRTDIRISYRRNKAKSSTVWSLDIQNASNRKNVFTQFYSDFQDRIISTYQLGLIPVLNWRLEF